MGNVTVDKCTRVFPNQKPWMDSWVKPLLKDRNITFRSGNRELYSAARGDLKKGIMKAKAEHRQRIENHLSNNNLWQVWQGIQQILNLRGQTNSGADSSTALAEVLKSFFALFETPASWFAATPPQPHPTSNFQALTVQAQEVEQMLSRVNPRKASGHDGALHYFHRSSPQSSTSP